jgi:hypothetical protein
MLALNRLIRPALAAVFALLLLAGCVPTAENPITAKQGANDPALIGAWKGTTNDGSAIWLHFLRGKDAEIGAVLLPRGTADKPPDEWSAFRLVTAEIKGTHYMSALWDYNDGKPVEGREKGYHLVRYELGADGVLSLYLVNEEKLIAAVEAGKLEGKIEGEGTSKEVRVTASSEKLARFLRHIDPTDLFDKPFVKATLVN